MKHSVMNSSSGNLATMKIVDVFNFIKDLLRKIWTMYMNEPKRKACPITTIRCWILSYNLSYICFLRATLQHTQNSGNF